jgi:vacuolar-type H+-ATPase subunit I/STV1
MRKVVEDFRRGTEKIRWFSSLFAERMKIEIAVVKLRYDEDKIARTRDDLLKRIGGRIMELKSHEDKNIFKDTVVAEAISEIEKIDKSLEETRSRISDMGRVTE